MTERRLLIVNADDFGLSSSVNAAVFATHLHGIVTSASLMVRPKAGSLAAAQEAVRWANEHPGLSLGLHIDLGEWQYVQEGVRREATGLSEGLRLEAVGLREETAASPRLLEPQASSLKPQACPAVGHWEALYEVVPLDDGQRVTEEVRRQVEQFQDLAGKPPTHIDSHQHVHRDEPVRSAVLGVARELNVPVRHFAGQIQYRGEFYGQSSHGEPWPEGVSVAALNNVIAGLSPGVTELGCHPSWDDDLQTMYCRERRIEADSLCDPRVRLALDACGVELISFNGLRS